MPKCDAYNCGRDLANCGSGPKRGARMRLDVSAPGGTRTRAARLKRPPTGPWQRLDCVAEGACERRTGVAATFAYPQEE
jgi:hypothetical protein